MIVQKFGGTSIGTSERILNVAKIIKENFEKEPVLAVVSAISSYVKSEGTTSQLLKAAQCAIHNESYQEILNSIRKNHNTIIKESIENKGNFKEIHDLANDILDKLNQFLDALTVIKELSPRSTDRIIRVGEKLSAIILGGILRSLGLPARFVDLSNIAPKNYTSPTPQFYKHLEVSLAQLLNEVLVEKQLPVITGFVGEIPGGIIDSIGRGYTDYTSSLIAAVLHVRELQIWKEVDGIFTADPKIVKEAEVLSVITPQEAAELTYFGSEVIHPFTMERVTRVHIPVRIKNTFSPETPGTLVSDTEKDSRLIKSITAKRNVIILNICSNRMLMAYGFMAKVFRSFEKYGVVIDLISTSEVSISLTVEKCERINELIEELSSIGEVSFYSDKAILSMVGQNMRSTIGIAGKMFSCLSENGINIEMISQGASEINISCVIQNEEVDKAVQALHKRFISSNSNFT
ncbi:MAG: aspartate kinase [Spirochaetota bacterium]|nr:aspartate kinase [Spirochaetota bacterium]